MSKITGIKPQTVNLSATTSGTNLGIGTLSPSQVLSLSNLNTSTFQWANTTSSGAGALFGNDINIHPLVKKYEIYESPEDVLALSVAWKRLRDENIPRSFSKLLDRELFNKVQPSDREKAQVIRDYYSKKILMWKLKSINMTKYRQDLNEFIVSDGTKFPETTLPLAFRLPEFYDYDVALDGVRTSVNPRQQFTKMNAEGNPRTLKLNVPLTPLKCLHRKVKNSDLLQYWFRDPETNAGVVLNLSPKNELKHMWDHMFNNSPTIHIQGSYTRKEIDDFEHFLVSEWQLDYSKM